MQTLKERTPLNCIRIHFSDNISVECGTSNKMSEVPFLGALTFWRRIFFQILAHPVLKM